MERPCQYERMSATIPLGFDPLSIGAEVAQAAVDDKGAERHHGRDDPECREWRRDRDPLHSDGKHRDQSNEQYAVNGACDSDCRWNTGEVLQRHSDTKQDQRRRTLDDAQDSESLQKNVVDHHQIGGKKPRF